MIDSLGEDGYLHFGRTRVIVGPFMGPNQFLLALGKKALDRILFDP